VTAESAASRWPARLRPYDDGGQRPQGSGQHAEEA
jgi:hypothetical protein